MDKESGYYFYNARHYDLEIARFVTPDTVIDGENSTQGWNRFSYVHNNPIRYKDPTGHERDEIKTSHNNPELKRIRELNAQKDSNKTFDMGNKKISGSQLQQKLQIAKGKQQLFQNKCNEQLRNGLINLAIKNQEIRNTVATVYVTTATGLPLSEGTVTTAGVKAAGKGLIEVGKDFVKYGGPIITKTVTEMVKNAKELVKPVVAAAVRYHDKIIEFTKGAVKGYFEQTGPSTANNTAEAAGIVVGNVPGVIKKINEK